MAHELFFFFFLNLLHLKMYFDFKCGEGRKCTINIQWQLWKSAMSLYLEGLISAVLVECIQASKLLLKAL